MMQEYLADTARRREIEDAVVSLNYIINIEGIRGNTVLQDAVEFAIKRLEELL